MTSSMTDHLRMVVEGAWRQRVILAVTTLAIFLLGVAYAAIAPRTYVAKSLLLLQESGGDLPSREIAAAVRAQERIAGLRALLKSDLVLYSAMLDIEGENAPTKPSSISPWIRDLSNSLTLELLGNDFLEFQLKGRTPKGLGKQLEAVTARFLEALLSTNEAMNATQVLLDRRKDEVDAAERAYSQFKARMRERVPPTYFSERADLAEQTNKLQSLQRELSIAMRELQEIRSAGDSSPPAVKLQLTPGEAEKPGSRSGGAQPSRTELKPTQHPSGTSSQIGAAESRVAALNGQIEKQTQVVTSLQRTVATYAPLENQLKTLEAELQKAKNDHESFSKRFAVPNSGRAQGLLRAPERIKLIDAPRDPEFPTNSVMKIVMAALLLGVGLGVALAFAAEYLDGTVRYTRELEALTGVPVIARLPSAR